MGHTGKGHANTSRTRHQCDQRNRAARYCPKVKDERIATSKRTRPNKHSPHNRPIDEVVFPIPDP